MAPLLAPYNNAMRLGQGFNSYTQQICLHDAVMQPSKVAQKQNLNGQQKTSKSGVLSTPDLEHLDIQEEFSLVEHEHGNTQSSVSSSSQRLLAQNSGQEVSQIVSYSSRFVDKLSDVTNAMNISASLSIKTATIGGAASGSFIDSDKFKESDLNFFIQVKVVNQVVIGEDYTEFQNVLPANANFTETYGDTFISGFEEGGELNALISVKSSDKSKTFAIKASLEATLGTPALSGEVQGGIDINQSELKNSTETTVTVNWSGGGQIKPTNAIWDVNSLTLAASNFPDLVAKTPQRTYAILSRYTSLKSFLKIYQPVSVLSYENAGIYTSSLLDVYMDYKSIWKQIQVATFELKNRRADMRVANPPPEILALATSDDGQNKHGQEHSVQKHESQGIATPALPAVSPGQAPAKSSVSESKTVTSDEPPQAQITQGSAQSVTEIPNLIRFVPYTASVLGLEKAKKDCRNEMVKIVSEVDLVTAHPDLALDPHREDRFVSPRVFTQLLPIVTLRPVEPSGESSSNQTIALLNPKDPMILGESEEAPRLQQWLFNRLGNKQSPQPYPAMLPSLDRNKGKSNKFDMGDDWAGVPDPGKLAIWFNHLDVIDSSWIPKALYIWTKTELIIGLQVWYTNGQDLTCGACVGNATKTIEFHEDKDLTNHTVMQIILETAEPENSTARVRALQMTFDTMKRVEFPEIGRNETTQKKALPVPLTPPTNGLWSFRGFWGSVAPYDGGFPALGVIWGLDESSERSKPASQPGQAPAPSGPDYRMFTGHDLPEDVLKTAIECHNSREKSGKFSFSNILGGPLTNKEKLDYFNDASASKPGWQITSVKFYVKANEGISGYVINYTDDHVIERGHCQKETTVTAASREVSYWISARLVLDKPSAADELPVITFVEVADVGSTKIKFSAPGTETGEWTTFMRPDKTWAVGGFWGYYHRDRQLLTHLGVVWAKRSDIA